MQGRVGVFLLPAPSVFLFGVGIVLVAVVEYGHDVGNGLERAPQVEELVLLEVGVLHACALYACPHVVEVLQGEVFHLLHQAAEFPYLPEPLVYLFGITAERHVVHLLLAQRREALLAQHVAYFVETYLLFEIVWVCHVLEAFLPFYLFTFLRNSLTAWVYSLWWSRYAMA